MTNSTSTIEIIINGEPRAVTAELTVTDLLTQLALTPERVAIEFNLAILPRKTWHETKFQPGDKLEIVHFVGGG